MTGTRSRAERAGARRKSEAPVWLVGMMGCGKSTVGPLLAERLGRSFIDTDREIESAAGRSIAEIFAGEGEAEFRRLEAQAIERVAEGNAVVALGGGAIAQPGAAERLCASGLVVYLRAAPSVLARRVGRAANRPLLAGLSHVERVARLEGLLAERAGCYERAQLVIDTDAKQAGEVVEEIVVRGFEHGEAERDA